MKVKIGPYKNWFGPYHLAEVLCFWAKKETDEYGFKSTPDWVHNFGTWLAEDKNGNDTLLTKFCLWIESKRKRKIKIHIDKWDTWSMDHTLALIALPMLKQLRESKHGAPSVDLDDVPEHLRPNKEEQEIFETDGTTDPKFFDRWNWIMDEMIFAFEHIVDDDWESKYHSGEYDLQSKPIEWNDEGKAILFEMVEGPNHTAKTDYDAIKEIQNRIDRGLLFFGKYYRSLWD
jgi:hypothetical protein